MPVVAVADGIPVAIVAAVAIALWRVTLGQRVAVVALFLAAVRCVVHTAKEG